MSSETWGRRYVGRRVVVVGAATGIGLATAHRLAGEGAQIALTEPDAADAAAAASGLPGAGHVALRLDVFEPDSVSAAIAGARRSLGGIDALVHVAGGATPHGRFEETPDEIWQRMFEFNLLGPVRTLRAAIPSLRESDRGPAAVVISSVNALVNAGSEPYSAAKAGLGPVIAMLAEELGPAGIRVNGVAPGTTRTRVWDAQGGPDRFAERYPLRRVGEPEDIAAAVAFLCSVDADWITGHVLPVDGGLRVRRMF